MPDFKCIPVDTSIQFAVKHNAATYAAADGEIDDVIYQLRSTEAPLCQHSSIAIVLQVCLDTDIARGHADYRDHIPAGQLRGPEQAPGSAVKWPTTGDASCTQTGPSRVLPKTRPQ